MASFHSIWPFDNLRLESPRLLLRPIQDGDIAGLVNATLAGIHEPDRKFTGPGEVQESTRYRLPREDFRRPDWQLTVSGHEAVAPLLGA